MSKTKIEYVDLTINPVVGCSKCSPGCDNCYAEKMAARWAKHPNPKIRGKYAGVVDESGKWTGKLNFDLSTLYNLPQRPQRVFVGSMTDIFHDDIQVGEYSKSFLPTLFDHMDILSRHTFMILTKRSENMKRWIDFTLEHCVDKPMSNLWLGVTVCNQAEADEKIPVLLETPAAKRFVSIEPMLGPVDLTSIDYPDGLIEDADESGMLDALRGLTMDDAPTHPALDWVICGGETGPNARPMHPDWVRSLRDQCQAAGVPFFFKGWGEWGATGTRLDTGLPSFAMFESFTRYCNKAPTWMHKGDKLVRPDGHVPTHGAEEGKSYPMYIVRRLGKKRSGRLLDGREWNEFPEAR